MAMLPRITADESMLASTRIAIGSGTAAREDAMRVRDHWEQASAGPVDRNAGPRAPSHASAEHIKSFHIGVRRVKKRRNAEAATRV